MWGQRVEVRVGKPLRWLLGSPPLPLNKSPQLVSAGATVRIHRLTARCLAFGDCFISFLLPFSVPPGQNNNNNKIKRCFKWKK